MHTKPRDVVGTCPVYCTHKVHRRILRYDRVLDRGASMYFALLRGGMDTLQIRCGHGTVVTVRDVAVQLRYHFGTLTVHCAGSVAVHLR